MSDHRIGSDYVISRREKRSLREAAIVTGPQHTHVSFMNLIGADRGGGSSAVAGQNEGAAEPDQARAKLQKSGIAGTVNHNVRPVRV